MNDFEYLFEDAAPYASRSDNFWAIMPIVMSILGVILVIALILGITCYVFNSIGLYSMARKRNLDHAWLAWIPIASYYLKGSLINDDVSIGSWHIPFAKIFLPLIGFALSLVMSILGLIPYIGIFFGLILSLAIGFYYYTAQFWLFSIYDKDHRVVYLVLSIIFPFLGPIFTFIIRNKDAVDERHPEEIVEVNYDSKSIIALSLGVFSIVSFFIPTLMGTGLISGAVGIIFGIIAMKELKLQSKPTGMALAGLICSIVGIAFTILILFACVVCIGVGATGILGGLLNNIH